MDIRNTKEIRQFAAQRLSHAREDKKIVTIFAGIVIGMSVLSAVVSYVLNLQIDQTGGLSNMGTRSVLSALQTMLPLVQSVVVMCLELGYVAAMLRVARGQYTSPQTLRLGFDRFWVLLRFTLIESMLFMGIGFACIYLGIMIYLMTPLSASVMELLMPYVSQNTILDAGIVISDTLYDQLMPSLTPAFLICGLLYAVAAVPLMYRLRMAGYVIIDKPGLGAMAALRESRKMMKGNCISLFRLDISMWWYYAAALGASIVCYGDQILPLLGIQLPFSAEVSFFLFYALYWVLEFLIFYYLRNRVDVAYGLAYDAIRPEEKQGGVVLGNIFQM